MPQIRGNGIDLHYEEAGSGKPLLLLHGGLGTALLHFWREIEFFSQQYHVIAPDLRGYGRSTPPRRFPPNFYAIDAADVVDLIEALALGPVHLAGWSDGGIVALLVTLQRPELVRTLSLWGAQARITAEERISWDALADTSTWSEGARRRFIEAQGPLNWPGILKAMLDGYHGFYNTTNGDIASGRLGEIHVPTLVMHGARDEVVPVLHAHELGRGIPDVRVRIFENAGHAVHREREAELRQVLLDFLAQYP